MSSTPRKPSTPFQLWREEHLKQEMGVHHSVLGQIDTLPTNTARISMEVMGATASPRRTSEPARKYPPTKLYIEDEPDKKVETFMRWKQQRREQDEDTVSETRHLSELEREIEIVQSREKSRERQLSGESETSGQVSRSDQSRKKDKKSSISSILSVFTRKKSLKKKKSSLTAMMEKEAAGSVLDPEAQKKIIEQPEGERSKSPYQEWRSLRSEQERSEPHQVRQSVTPLSLRSPTPDPDYDNLSFQSNSPRAPRIRPAYDDNSSDTSFEDYGGRYTPRSAASEYGRNIPRYQPMPNILSGLSRGVSPAISETGGAKRSPSTDSFFGKNGASVGQQANSQIWYQKYKHSSFSHPNQTSFGEPTYGAFDGRISKFRGKNVMTGPRQCRGSTRHLYLHSAAHRVKSRED